VSPRLEVFDDEDWADRVVDRWATVMRDAPASRLCLPAGETPVPVYAGAARRIDFTAATVFALDEFDLPLGHLARCDSMLRRDFLDRLTTPPAAIHLMNPAAPDRDAECRRYESIVKVGGLDLTPLGLGGNGHLGLNEPGSMPDAPTRVVRLAPSTIEAAARYGPDAEPEIGMTLGMRPILASGAIWLLVAGAHKAEILHRTLNGPIGPDVPASYLRHHRNAVVLADRSAAGNLATPIA
jgi:glucosamine-6-phosphate deaminase